GRGRVSGPPQDLSGGCPAAAQSLRPLADRPGLFLLAGVQAPARPVEPAPRLAVLPDCRGPLDAGPAAHRRPAAPAAHLGRAPPSLATPALEGGGRRAGRDRAYHAAHSPGLLGRAQSLSAGGGVGGAPGTVGPATVATVPYPRCQRPAVAAQPLRCRA